MWRAEGEASHAPYAVRVFKLQPSLRQKESCLLDLEELCCRNLPRIEEAFVDATHGLYCIVMELVDGTTLEQLM